MPQKNPGHLDIAHVLEGLSAAAQKMRDDASFDPDADASGLPPMAEQHVLLALAALETAARHFKLAQYLSMRGE